MTLGPRTVLLTGDQNGCTLYRATLPALACQAHDAPVEWVQWADHDRDACVAAAAVVVFARLHVHDRDWTLAEDWLARLRAGGKTLLWEQDDDLLSDAVLPHQYETWPETPPAAHDAAHAARWRMVRQMDGLTVSTERLATLTRQLTGLPVRVVPNRLPWRWWQRVARTFPRTLAAPVVGWVGGDRTAADFAPMLTAWGRLAVRYPALRFVVACGRLPTGLYDVVPPERITVRPWVPPAASPLQWRDVDIACLPLSAAEFNLYKSPLKSYEAACAGAAIVASPVIYGEVCRPEADALFAETADEWEAALSRLIEQPKQRAALARRWAAKVQSRYTLERGWSAWPRAWASLHAAVQQSRREGAA